MAKVANSETIAWIYDGNIWCNSCALERFGAKSLENGNARDLRGNQPRPVLADEEIDTDDEGWEICADYLRCGTVLAEPAEPNDND